MTQLTVKGKPLKNKNTIPITGSLQCKVFNWGDGYYHVELQRYDGIIWKREGQTKCLTNKELNSFKKEMNL